MFRAFFDIMRRFSPSMIKEQFLIRYSSVILYDLNNWPGTINIKIKFKKEFPRILYKSNMKVRTNYSRHLNVK